MTARHLRRPTTWLAVVMALALSWPGIAPRALAAAGASDGGVQVRVAQNLETTRIEFAGSLGGRATVKRQGQALVVRIAGKVQPDLTRLRIYPPPFIKGAVSQFAGAATEVTITLTDNADASSGNADGAVYINVFKRKPVEAKSAPDAAALKAAKGQTDKSEDVKSPNDPALVSATTDPRPASGVLPVAASSMICSP